MNVSVMIHDASIYIYIYIYIYGHLPHAPVLLAFDVRQPPDNWESHV